MAWLWRRRHHASASVRNATPRRLVYCLPTRVLVEQTVQEARAWLTKLDFLATDSGSAGRIAVYQLMAGESGNDWDAWPESEAVLVGTQDQLISRALNRGYGTSRSRWPLQCGLLNSDALWVFDEVQLMGPAREMGCIRRPCLPVDVRDPGHVELRYP